jgi:hypothetical protein
MFSLKIPSYIRKMMCWSDRASDGNPHNKSCEYRLLIGKLNLLEKPMRPEIVSYQSTSMCVVNENPKSEPFQQQFGTYSLHDENQRTGTISSKNNSALTATCMQTFKADGISRQQHTQQRQRCEWPSLKYMVGSL